MMMKLDSVSEISEIKLNPDREHETASMVNLEDQNRLSAIEPNSNVNETMNAEFQSSNARLFSALNKSNTNTMADTKF